MNHYEPFDSKNALTDLIGNNNEYICIHLKNHSDVTKYNFYYTYCVGTITN